MKRVLLVDDDLPFRDMLGHALSLAGFTIESDATGGDAIAKVRQEPIDAVVLDIIMPEMDGIEALREIRRLQSDLPVIVMSGGGRLAAKCYLPMAQRLGATAALEKPFRPGDLVQLLRQCLAVDEATAPAPTAQASER